MDAGLRSPKPSKATTRNTTSDRRAQMAVDSLSANSDSAAKPFRLLDLPDELILRVVEYAVVTSTEDSPIRLWSHRIGVAHSKKMKYTTTCFGGSPGSAITQACRVLRKEGLKLHYSRNFFIVHARGDDLQAMLMWAKKIGEEYASSLANLLVRYQSRGFADFESEMYTLRYVQAVMGLEYKTFVRKVPGPKESGNMQDSRETGDRLRYQVSFGRLGKGEKMKEDGGDWFEIKKIVLKRSL